MKVTWLIPNDLRWECVKCGRCCMNLFEVDFRDVKQYAKVMGVVHYGPDSLPSNLPYIYIHEARKITRELNIRYRRRFHVLDVFVPLQIIWRENETYISDIGFTFRPHPSGFHCPFLNLKTKLCRIHPIRPNACRLFPFYEAGPVYQTDLKEIVVMVDLLCQGIGRGEPVNRAQILNLFLERQLLARQSMKYWKKKKVPVKPQIEYVKKTGRMPSPTEAIKTLNLRKYVSFK